MQGEMLMMLGRGDSCLRDQMNRIIYYLGFRGKTNRGIIRHSLTFPAVQNVLLLGQSDARGKIAFLGTKHDMYICILTSIQGGYLSSHPCRIKFVSPYFILTSKAVHLHVRPRDDE